MDKQVHFIVLIFMRMNKTYQNYDSALKFIIFSKLHGTFDSEI